MLQMTKPHGKTCPEVDGANGSTKRNLDAYHFHLAVALSLKGEKLHCMTLRFTLEDIYWRNILVCMVAIYVTIS